MKRALLAAWLKARSIFEIFLIKILIFVSFLNLASWSNFGFTAAWGEAETDFKGKDWKGDIG